MNNGNTASARKTNRRLLIVISIIMAAAITTGALLFSYYYTTNYGVKPEIKASSNNVILLIAEGVGKEHIEAADIYGKTEMTKMPVSSSMFTRSLNLSPTDAAASSTAFATGVKVKNGNAGVNDGKTLENLAEYAKTLGKKVGVITNGRVTDATPAAFSAHNKKASDRGETAKQQIRNSDIDVLIGYGKSDYEPYENEIERNDREYCGTLEDFLNTEKPKTYAVFDDDFSLDLANMTRLAISNNLANSDGFFLMVTSPRIAERSLENDINGMLYEIAAFDRAVTAALEYAAQNADTTVIVAGSYEAGKLAIKNGATPDDINDSLFNSQKVSNDDTVFFAKGKGESEIPKELDNTDIYYIIKQLFANHGK